jgi:Fe2+ transport system protein B
MNWNEIFQIVSGVIISVGGAGAIIWKLSSYLGEIWAKKHLESIKKEYQKEIEAYKSQLDMLKETSLRYSGQQFELYNNLWHSLYALRSTADVLWEEAREQNLIKFSQQLKKTMDEVEKSYLFIEENHYRELKDLLKQFSDYQFGKTKLIQLYKQRTDVNHQEIGQWIDHNRERKEKYEELIDKIKEDLKRQIRGGR